MRYRGGHTSREIKWFAWGLQCQDGSPGLSASRSWAFSPTLLWCWVKDQLCDMNPRSGREPLMKLGPGLWGPGWRLGGQCRGESRVQARGGIKGLYEGIKRRRQLWEVPVLTILRDWNSNWGYSMTWNILGPELANGAGKVNLVDFSG